jgi:hypothetical protein
MTKTVISPAISKPSEEWTEARLNRQSRAAKLLFHWAERRNLFFPMMKSKDEIVDWFTR